MSVELATAIAAALAKPTARKWRDHIGLSPSRARAQATPQRLAFRARSQRERGAPSKTANSQRRSTLSVSLVEQHITSSSRTSPGRTIKGIARNRCFNALCVRRPRCLPRLANLHHRLCTARPLGSSWQSSQLGSARASKRKLPEIAAAAREGRFLAPARRGFRKNVCSLYRALRKAHA